MKYLILVICISLSSFAYSQDANFNLEEGYVAKGYDVVAYFDKKAVEGKEEFSTTHNGLNLKFSSQKNLDKFNTNPEHYLPQYGGWCAYALAISEDKVDINPEAFEIRDDKLYLFYKTFPVNTLKKWKKKNPEKLRDQADRNWTKISPEN